MIQQNNPLANYLSHKSDIDEAIDRVLTSGCYILGEETENFEREFAAYVGVKYAVGTGNGTEALYLALRACHVGPGDEVITVSHTAVATVSAIRMCGARPVMVDIVQDSYTIDPMLVEKAITENTKAIVPVHIYGQPAALAPLIECAGRYNLSIIEDCAQAHGAVYNEHKVGSYGDAGAFSFYPTKNLSCFGDGGVVTTNNSDLYHRLLSLRQYGWDQHRVSKTEGYNSRLDELQAAVLRVKLKYLDETNQKRTRIAHAYRNKIEDLPLSPPALIPSTSHVYHQYVIRCSGNTLRNDLIKFMRDRGIVCGIHYPNPVHLHPAFCDTKRNRNSLSVTEGVAKTIISLPMFPELCHEDVEMVSRCLHEYFNSVG